MYEYLLFRLGGDRFGIDVHRIVEVDYVGALRNVPEMPEFVSGVKEKRGRMIPVIDMRRRLGIDSVPGKQRVVIVRLERERIGLLVDEVTGIKKIDKGKITIPKTVYRGLKKKYLTGLFKEGEEIIIMLDTDNILTSDERLQIKKARVKARAAQ